MRGSKRDRMIQKAAVSQSRIRQRHAKKRLKERAGEMDFQAFRSHVLDHGCFDRLECQQDRESWLCHSEFEGRSVYFILKDDPETRGREIATVLSKGMAMEGFPQVFGSPGSHMTLEERKEEKDRLRGMGRRIDELQHRIAAMKTKHAAAMERLEEDLRLKEEHASRLATRLAETAREAEGLRRRVREQENLGILGFFKQRIFGKADA